MVVKHTVSSYPNKTQASSRHALSNLLEVLQPERRVTIALIRGLLAITAAAALAASSWAQNNACDLNQDGS